MFAAFEKPKKNSINSELIIVVLPTAARAFVLINRPAIAISRVLNICKKMLVATRGRANIIIFFIMKYIIYFIL